MPVQAEQLLLHEVSVVNWLSSWDVWVYAGGTETTLVSPSIWHLGFILRG